MKNELKAVMTASIFTPANWKNADRAIINPSDIRCPWKSVYDFPTTAARLAAGQEMVLHCREDEVFELLAGLNDLLQRPESLNRAYTLLKKLEEKTCQKLTRLLELEGQPLTEDEIPDLFADVEQILTEPAKRTVTDRLASALSPHNPVKAIPGSRAMLTRLQRMSAALQAVKDQGFRVVVRDRRRQPYRPALEARRNEPVLLDREPCALPARFLLPTRYHLTLWAYLVLRDEGGQSPVWN